VRAGDDGDLIDAARRGDRGALDRLLRRHYDRLYALCRRMTGNEPDALDAAQEALIAIAKGLPRFDGRSSFATWSYRVTANACLDELRRRQRRPIPAAEDGQRVDAGARSGPSLGDSVVDRLSLDDAIGALPVEFRAAVVLRDVIGLDYAEIAAVLEIPAGTVRSRIARGRAQLANTLGNPAGPPDRQKSEA
jgi:RNA polymerase sigma-70 factor (ECF subfamily)